MAYCTKTDLLGQIPEETLIQLTDDTGSGSEDDAAIAGAISDADAEIEAYCGENYTLPFDPVPVIIRKVSVDISIYNLYARRQGAPDDRAKRYDNAVKLLRDIAAGRVSLGASAPTETSQDTVEASTSAGDRIFTKTTLGGF